MARYNLTVREKRLIEFFIFGRPGGPLGLLDWGVVANSNPRVSARDALALDGTLDVTQWVRDNPQEFPVHSQELAMCWWIWKNDGVNITPPTRPSEAPTWLLLIADWDQSIVRGFNRRGQAGFNAGGDTTIRGQAGDEEILPTGDYLAAQQPLYQKVRAVLE